MVEQQVRFRPRAATSSRLQAAGRIVPCVDA